MWCLLVCTLFASLMMTESARRGVDHAELGVDAHPFSVPELEQCRELAGILARRWDLAEDAMLKLARYYFFHYHDLPLADKTARADRQIKRLRPVFERIEVEDFLERFADFRRRALLPAIADLNFCWNNSALVADGRREELLRLNLELGRYYNPYLSRSFKPKKDDCAGMKKFAACAARWHPEQTILQETYNNLSRYAVECPSAEAAWDRLQDFYGSARLSLALAQGGFNATALRSSGRLRSSHRKVRHLLGGVFPRYAHLLRWWPPAADARPATHGGFLRATLGALVLRDDVLRAGLRRAAGLVSPHFDERVGPAAELRYPDYHSNVLSLPTYAGKLRLAYEEAASTCGGCAEAARNLTGRRTKLAASARAALDLLVVRSELAGHRDDGGGGEEAAVQSRLRAATETYRRLSTDVREVGPVLANREVLHHVLLFALPFLAEPGHDLARATELLERAVATAHLLFPSADVQLPEVTTEMLHEALREYAFKQSVPEDKLAFQLVLKTFNMDASNYFVNIVVENQLNRHYERAEVLWTALSPPRPDVAADARRLVRAWLRTDLASYARHLPDVRLYAHLDPGVYLRDAAEELLSQGLVPAPVARHLRLLLPLHVDDQRAGLVADHLGGERLEERRKKFKQTPAATAPI